MKHARVAARTDEGIADGRLFRPNGAGPWPLVVFYMDAFGLRPTLDQMAQRLAEHGYAVLQPNLYWRIGRFEPFDPASAFQDPEQRKLLMQIVETVQPKSAIADTRALAARVAADDDRIRADQIGSLGYCMGGRLAFLSATQMPDQVVVAASIHPGGLVTDRDDSPHRAVASIRATIYIAAADRDQSFTPEHRLTLGAALGEARIAHMLEVCDGKRHGFAVPDLPVYDAAAAERQWERVLSLFDSRLRSTPPSGEGWWGEHET
jgi:carboxymethylenebutenolidase